jgi:hippurate hydrolase
MRKMILSFLALLLASPMALAQQSPLPEGFSLALERAVPRLDSLYRALHQHPEIAGDERWTSQTLATEMRQLGYEVHDSVGGHGLVCLLRNGPGDTIMYRCDMDGLDVREQTGLSYASQRHLVGSRGDTTWFMHGCSHDMHMAVWLGVARMMAQHRHAWRGLLICVAQPSEENGAGAKAMLDAGLWQRWPRPKYALALHDDARLEAGKVAVAAGKSMAHTTSLDITLRGRSAHGGYPHLGIDVILMAARCILDFQGIISREMEPGTPAVITVGKIAGGTRRNQLPDALKMELTLRSYDDTVNQYMIRRIREVCQQAAIAARVPAAQMPTVEIVGNETPVLLNNVELARHANAVFQKALGKEHVLGKTPVMGGEDFSRFGRGDPPMPILLYWLGTVSSADWAAAQRGEKELPSLHASRFAPDPGPTLRTGVLSMSALLLSLLR